RLEKLTATLVATAYRVTGSRVAGWLYRAVRALLLLSVAFNVLLFLVGLGEPELVEAFRRNTGGSAHHQQQYRLYHRQVFETKTWTRTHTTVATRAFTKYKTVLETVAVTRTATATVTSTSTRTVLA